RTATSSPCCFANFTHATTSSVVRQRAIRAGLRSIMAFQIARTLSNSGVSAVRISPLIDFASSFATEGSSVVLEPANVLNVRPDMRGLHGDAPGTALPAAREYDPGNLAPPGANPCVNWMSSPPVGGTPRRRLTPYARPRGLVTRSSTSLLSHATRPHPLAIRSPSHDRERQSSPSVAHRARAVRGLRRDRRALDGDRPPAERRSRPDPAAGGLTPARLPHAPACDSERQGVSVDTRTAPPGGASAATNPALSSRAGSPSRCGPIHFMSRPPS